MEVWNYIVNLWSNLGGGLTNWLSERFADWVVYLVMALIDIFVVINVILMTVLAFIWVERRLLAGFQIRYGPNRVGPFGLLQPVADAIKVLTKEDIIPTDADHLIHYLAPVVAFVPLLLTFAVIPFGKGAILADLNVGMLYIVSVGTIGGIGVFMAGWSSNNKYSLLGAMREISQMVSYEVPIVLSIIGVVMVAGSLSLQSIVEAQSVPFILLQPLGFLIYLIAVSAQINRSPMDLVEAECELVAGFHTEYSSMKFGLFYLNEYGSAFAASAIMTTLFLGGWQGPLLPPYVWFAIKVFALFGLFVWMRATLPRVRIDQVMHFGWKFLLPIALVNVFITAVELAVWPAYPWYLLFVNMALAVVLIVGWAGMFKLRGGVPVGAER